MLSDHKKAWRLFAVAGGIGTGKTRFSISILSLVLKELERNKHKYTTAIYNEQSKFPSDHVEPNVVYETLLRSLRQYSATLYIDCSSGDWFQKWETLPRTSFLFSLVSKVFFPNSKVESIQRSAKDYFDDSFDSQNVATTLREYFKVDLETPLTLVINLDEFQTKISKDDFEYLQNEKKDIFIRRIAFAVMEEVMVLAEHKVFIVPFFSGTISLAYVKMFPATMYSVVNFSLGPLKKESSVEIVNKELMKHGFQLPESLIGSMGDIPRALEYLVDAAVSNPALDHIHLFHLVVDRIRTQYPHGFSATIAKKLIQLCLVGKPVSREFQIAGIPIGILERDGVVFLEQHNYTGLCRVQVPLVFVAAWNQTLEMFDPKFVTYVPITQSKGFEKFGIDFEVFKNNLFIDLGITKTTFSERFSGALMSEQLASTPIRLSTMMNLHSKSERLPIGDTKIDIIGSETPVDLATDCASILFPQNCTACDSLTSYPNQSGNRVFIRLEQWKSTLIWKTSVLPSEILSERDAAMRGAMVPGDKFKIFFFFMTNSRLATPRQSRPRLQQDILSNNDTLVVTKEEFGEYFSPIFAPIAVGYGK
jgi:hypothetical protein